MLRALSTKALAFLLPLVTLHFLARNWFRRSSAYIPSGSLPIVGHFFYVANHYPTLLDTILSIVKKAKTKTFQFNLPFYPAFTFTVDPRNLEHVLSKNFVNYEKGQAYHDNIKILLGEGIFTSDGPRWKALRKTAGQIFTTCNFRDFFSKVFLEEAELLTNRLAKAAKTGEIVDLHDYCHRLTMDSFGRLAFGVNLRCLEEDTKRPFVEAFEGLQKICCTRFFVPGWQFYERLNGSAELAQKYRKMLDDFANEVISQHRANPNPESVAANADLITLLMAFKDENGNSTSDSELRDHVINFLMAGRDTTAQALAWTFYELSRNPRVLHRLVAEIDEAVGKIPEGENIDYERINTLTYAHCCVSETLRLHPSVAKNQKRAIADDVLPDGTRIPGGSFVLIVPWCMGRLTEIWGEDAEEYKPERWLGTLADDDEEELGPITTNVNTGSTHTGAFQAKMNQFKFPAFHAGPRLCLGQSMAYLEAVSVLASVLSKLRIEVIEPEKVKYITTVLLPMENGLKVRTHVRK